MKTSREFGYAYAEWGHTEKQDGFDGPVDVNAMIGGSVDIPEGDYRAMCNAGIEPDARQYWEGYNSYFASLGASLMGRKGGKSKSDAKTTAARENGRKGGRPRINKVQVIDRLDENRVVSEHRTWTLAEQAMHKRGCGERFALRVKFEDLPEPPRD